MTPTRVRFLLGLALGVGIVTWAVLRALDAVRGGFPAIGWTTPATVVILDVALLATVLAVRPRLLRRPGAKPLNPLLAARFAALALACSRVERRWPVATSASSPRSPASWTPRTAGSERSTRCSPRPVRSSWRCSPWCSSGLAGCRPTTTGTAG